MEEHEREETQSFSEATGTTASAAASSNSRGNSGAGSTVTNKEESSSPSSPQTSPPSSPPRGNQNEENRKHSPSETSTSNDHRNEQIVTMTALPPTGQQQQQQEAPLVVHNNRWRRKLSDDGSVLSNSSGEDLFEDEPPDTKNNNTKNNNNNNNNNRRLVPPKPSPNRLAARMERRKLSSRKHQHAEKESASPSLAKVGLPHLRAFRKESKADNDLDDNSSHWSSSDGEHEGGEGLRDVTWLSQDDIEICRRLDEEYERALEEREVVYTARYNSVRQSACFSVVFMLVYLALGTIFFMRQANWTVSDSVLFSVYTITTVGYGTLETPKTAAFQLYTIFFIFIGIAGITLMVAQTYQCIALEASRAEHSREQAQLARLRAEAISRSNHSHSQMAVASSEQNGRSAGQNNTSSPRIAQQLMAEMNIPTHWIDRIFSCIDKTKIFLSTTELGRSISVVLPFVGLILVGAMVIGPIEGWNFVESLYFAVVSLTTVGFGDYVPTHDASIVFCIIWLPCSIGFMSLFLTNVAAFYIRLSDKNIERIERQLRRRVKIAKEVARRERDAAKRRALRGQGLQSAVPAGAEGENGDDEGVAGVELMNSPTGDSKSVDSDSPEQEASESAADVHLFGSPETLGEEVATRREKILMNFRGQWQQDEGAESDGSGDSLIRKGKGIATMKDMLRAVHANMPKEPSRVFRSHGPEQEILSVRSNRFMDSHSLRQGSLRKPSFALRALVQERFAEIIAAEVAGFESSIEIKENTLSVTIGTLRQTTSKWMVPRRARRAFRAVAFEALYFVGEHGLITRGADALFDLSPMEFHRLFTPLLAALGDADSMEAWLATTDILAEVDLNRSSVPSSQSGSRGSTQQAKKS